MTLSIMRRVAWVALAGAALAAPVSAAAQTCADLSQSAGGTRTLTASQSVTFTTAAGDMVSIEQAVFGEISINGGAFDAAPSALAIDASTAGSLTVRAKVGIDFPVIVSCSVGGDHMTDAVEGLAVSRGWNGILTLPIIPNRVDAPSDAAFSGVAADGSGVVSFDLSLASFDALRGGDAFGAWARGTYSFVWDGSGAVDVDGHIGTLQIGVDYRPADGVVVGLLALGDWIRRDADGAAPTADGVGVMTGPYGAVEIDEDVFIEGMALVGWAWNTATSISGAEADYDSRRILLTARLSADEQRGRWMLRPQARVSWYAERSEAFFDGDGMAVDAGTEQLLQVRAGGEAGFDVLRDDRLLRPFVGADLVWSAADGRSGVGGSADGASGGSATLLGGVEGRIGDATFRGQATYDGLGGDINAFTASFDLRIPFR